MSAVVAAPMAVDVYAACYDLGARFYLNGPAAVCRGRLPAVDSLLKALSEVDPEWPARVERLLSRHDSPAALEQAESAYMQSVVLPVPGRYIPPYSSVYLGESMLWGAPTLETERLYAEYGLAWQAGATRMRPLAPDHLGLELAFLAVAESEAGARPSEEQADRLASFLDVHLLHWVPRYLDALHAAGADSLITDWVEWLLYVANHDLDRLR